MDLANSIVLLQPGLYILRHPKTGLPPLSISRAAGKPENNGQIQAIYTPGTDGGVLRSGSDAIVMQVLNAPVELLVTAYLEKAGATVPVIKIDKVQLDGSGETGSEPKAIQVPSKGLSIVGHIERKGDSVATDGNRLGDPKGDWRLEGFQIEWPDKPDGVDLSYSARIEGAPLLPSVTTGRFCGTRNAAKRLVAVRFELIGPKAGEYEVHGAAYFSGGFNSPITSGTLLSGPSGLEHLTALSLNVASTARGRAKKNPWDASSRTRVLRSPAAGSKKA